LNEYISDNQKPQTVGLSGGSVALETKVPPFMVPIVLLSLFVTMGHAQEPQKTTKAVQLTGLAGVKNNAKGILTVENGNLRFTHSKNTSDLAAPSIQDVVTGSDSQRVIRGTLGTLSMFGPYGSDRFMSLFRSKIDTLTIQYRDSDGGLHGAIFTSPVGTAEPTKDELVGLGAHTTIPTHGDPAPDKLDRTNNTTPAEQAREEKPAKMNPTAISVLMIQSDEVQLPAEFQVSLYENLIQQLQKKGGFEHVYREGDRNSSGVPNLIILHSTVRGFKKGSEMERQVTTVAGSTSISVHCEFTGQDGQLLLARDINGKVWIFGGNLRATYDFAKKAAGVAHDNVSVKAGT
jgi:hypothetical protein